MIGLLIAVQTRRRRTYAFPHHIIEPIEVGADRLTLYNYGRRTFEAMLDDIEAAQESIYLETYIFKADEYGMLFRKRLSERAAAGVKVYVLFDGIGSLFTPYFARTFSAKVTMHIFAPVHTLFDFFRKTTYIRDHRKILVVDNRVAYLGGMNIGREYARTWRDTHLRIEGPGARKVGASFADLWNAYHRKHPIAYDPADLDDCRDGSSAIQLCSSRYERRHRRRNTIRDMYMDAFERAQREIYVTNPYFLPDSQLFATLLDACHRGVAVHIMVPEKSNHPSVDILARPVYDRLMRAGAHLWLYQHTVIHSKTATIDGYWSTVGSANLDGRSMINYEINACINSREFAARMRDMFEDDKSNCRPARINEYGHPTRLERMLEGLLMPLRPYL